MEPLATTNNANSIILRIEKQMDIQVTIVRDNSVMALLARSQNARRFVTDGVGSGNKNRDNNKSYKKCVHHGGVGHTNGTCFKIYGYPNWYKIPTKRKWK